MYTGFLFLLFMVAFLYSSVGHGGASGYLALMSLFDFLPETMRITALILNIFVSGIAFLFFYRSGNFVWKKCWPFLVSSIPFAFLGGLLELNAEVFKIILGLVLLFPVLRLSGLIHYSDSKQINDVPNSAAFLSGALIGILAGSIGIGGGILLTPLLVLFHWAKIKQAAAISALFIFANSASGLFARFTQNASLNSDIYKLLLIALCGAMLGSYMGSERFKSIWLQRVLSFVLLIASVKLIAL
ncbi:MAG TPA: sulfite exporter TauE/SafE family protein [Bacteroidia bacterium]|nr:sulfite exporter TauE/SafE family protein [Bacteroidia bacterium]HNT79936.1 sulfite exporter TauE/SafE family protein [Bacteroidia bacterium]